jgi:hypothetical protein
LRSDGPQILEAPPLRLRSQTLWIVRHARARMLIRIILGTLWALFAGEMFLRVFAPQPLMPRSVTATDFGIRINTPNDEYWQKSREVSVRIHINSQGIRADEDIPLTKPPGVQRIVILGDSYGLGYEVNLEDAFTTRMADRLNAAGRRVQIVNLSVSGFGNAEELLMLQHRGFAFDPDLVLLAWHPTDLGDNVDSHLFALKDGQLVRDHPAYLPGVRTRRRLEAIPGYRWMERNSQLYTFLREKTAGKLEEFLAGNAYVPKWKQLAGSLPPTTAPTGPPSDADRLAVALLKEIQDECAQRGIKLLMLDVPTRFSRTDFLDEFPYTAAHRVADFDVISPLESFKAYYGQKLFWEEGYFHFTPLACRVVGHLLADHILKNQLLPPLPVTSAAQPRLAS